MATKRKSRIKNVAEEDRINRIEVVLTEKRIKQIELAEKLDVSTNTISAICNNINQPHLKDLKKIAKILNVNIKELLYDTPVK